MRTLIFGMLMLVGLGSQAHAQPAPEKKAPRRVYVLHSGMHIIFAPTNKNHCVETLHAELLRRGIPERDIVALDSPFPQATWSDVFPKEGWLLYLNATDPASKHSHDAYVRMHEALRKHDVKDDDVIVWIGHSAGGQIGMTMAQLAHNLPKHPALAKRAKAYRFERVVTLGTAVGANTAPNDVQLLHYYSPGDNVIGLLTKHGNTMSDLYGMKITFGPCRDMPANCTMRVFEGIEHPYWYSTARVLDCLLGECVPAPRPAWRRLTADATPQLGLAQLLAETLQREWRISLEELPAP
jgi:pimeloyl-ACP methyl ester carboxylesterase